MLEWFPGRFPEPEARELLKRARDLDDAADETRPGQLPHEVKRLAGRLDRRLPFYFRRSFLEGVAALGIAFFLVLGLRWLFLQPYEIQSGSMKPNLVPGDHLLVWKLPYGIGVPFSSWKIGGWREPRRGEVLVFSSSDASGRDLVKRVVGLPGDTVEVRAGQVYVNGEALPRIADGRRREVPEGREDNLVMDRYREAQGEAEYAVLYAVDGPGRLRDMAPRTLPAGGYFFMGDNRDHSYDSRAWGFVDYSRIRGTALCIYLSWGEEGQWRRIGNPVN